MFILFRFSDITNTWTYLFDKERQSRSSVIRSTHNYRDLNKISDSPILHIVHRQKRNMFLRSLSYVHNKHVEFLAFCFLFFRREYVLHCYANFLWNDTNKVAEELLWKIWSYKGIRISFAKRHKVTKEILDKFGCAKGSVYSFS